MELNIFHVDQRRAGVIGERMSVAGAIPTVARDLVGLADPARGENDCLGAKNSEPAALAIVPECADDTLAILEQRHDANLHVNIDALMDAVILQACGSSPTRCDLRHAQAADTCGRRNFFAESARP